MCVYASIQTRGASVQQHKGLYKHPVIQRVINEVLFKHRNSDGARLPDYYKPFPPVGFALALTAVGTGDMYIGVTDHICRLRVVLTSGQMGLVPTSNSRRMCTHRSSLRTLTLSWSSTVLLQNMGFLNRFYSASMQMDGE